MLCFVRLCAIVSFAFFAGTGGTVSARIATSSARIDAVQLLPRAKLSTAAWDATNDTYSREYVYPPTRPVHLNGCSSRIDGVLVQDSALPGPSWLLEPLDRQSSAPITIGALVGSCQRTVRLPAMGRWRITLTIRDADGVAASAVRVAAFRDVLVAVVGDSFASGEGNPARGLPGQRVSKRWIDAQCHRSTNAWPDRIGRSLENDSTAVTFVSFACSGADVTHLTDNTYEGAAPDGQKPLKRQIGRLHSLLGNPLRRETRPVDLLLGSVGINALNVASTLKDCAADQGPGGIECQKDFSRQLDALSGQYDELELSLSANIKRSGNFNLIQYPSRIMTDENDEYPRKLGAFCSANPVCTAHALGCGAFARMQVEDKQWITGTVDSINTALHEAARRHHWILTPTVDLFRHHGYCALFGRSWFRSVAQSLESQHNVNGTAHPNSSGHIATFEAVRRQVQIDDLKTPTPERLVVRFLRLRVTPEAHPERSFDKRPRWDGRASIGVMRGARNSCDAMGFTELTGRINRDGWNDLSTKPCMSYTVATAGRTFAVRARVGIQRALGAFEHFQVAVERFHVRANNWNATVDPPGLAAQPRQHLAFTQEGYGTFEIEYTITKETKPGVIGP
jgi:hypothetical protein